MLLAFPVSRWRGIRDAREGVTSCSGQGGRCYSAWVDGRGNIEGEHENRSGEGRFTALEIEWSGSMGGRRTSEYTVKRAVSHPGVIKGWRYDIECPTGSNCFCTACRYAASIRRTALPHSRHRHRRNSRHRHHPRLRPPQRRTI